DILRNRISSLKAERERIRAALDRAQAQTDTAMAIDAEKIQAFSRLMTEKLDNGDVNSRKSYIRAIVSAEEVDDHAVRIIGSPAVLSAAIAGKQTANSNVRGFARKWRARKDSNL
ncbi:MAG: recombinase family protein, partial [Hyphomicrobiales bacterium]|nr:recombinase family protein [Hyphomicrobiales bacterium]